MKPSLSNNQMGLLELKGAYVVFAAPRKGLYMNIFTITTASGETVKVRIAKGEKAEMFLDKVNALWHKKVDLVVHRSPWSAGSMTGVSNFLQSIEASRER